jgi:16S rRNA (cytidine1402-2'-O)-methyltransferase
LPATLCGFLPARPGPRRRRIAEFADCPWTLVVLLSPHRLKREIGDLAVELGGDREATLLAEISKKFERARMGTLDELVDSDEAANPRGEYVLVVAPPRTEAVRPEINGEAVRAEYDLAIADGLARPDAMRRAARRLGLRRREVFAVLSGGEPGDERESPPSGS